MNVSQLNCELLEIRSNFTMSKVELGKLKKENKQLIEQLHRIKPGDAESQVAYFYEHM